MIQNTPNGQKQILLWQRNETQARVWRTAGISIRDVSYEFSMKIDGYVGNGWEGDVS